MADDGRDARVLREWDAHRASAAPSPSLGKNAGRLARRGERQNVYSYLRSIYEDAIFVDAVRRGIARGLPALANLRCGAWYAASYDGDCYFKSTDGHTHRWAFSLSRVNAHVAFLAAEHGGVLIVDSTKSVVKRFPDALSKTIPVWCAVINGAAALDATLHLPPWIPDHERAMIAPLIAGWADGLARRQPALVSALSRALSAPLRPLWLNDASRGLFAPAGVDSAAPFADAPSLPPSLSPLEAALVSPLSERSEQGFGFTPLYLLSASKDDPGAGPRTGTARPPPSQPHNGAPPNPSLTPSPSPTPTPTQPHTRDGGSVGGRLTPHKGCRGWGWGWHYVHGAADDHEGWAGGLTPRLFWQHHDAILGAGPARAEHLIADLVAAERGGGGGGGGEETIGKGKEKGEGKGKGKGKGKEKGKGKGKGKGKERGEGRGEEGQGEKEGEGEEAGNAGGGGGAGSHAASARLVQRIHSCLPDRVHWLRDLARGANVGVASAAAVNAAGLHGASAVLNCACAHDVSLGGFTGCSAEGGAKFKFQLLKVPVASHKFDRQGLRRILGEALAFVLDRLAEDADVMIVCDDGQDIAPAVATAVCLALFPPFPPEEGGEGGEGKEGREGREGGCGVWEPNRKPAMRDELRACAARVRAGAWGRRPSKDDVRSAAAFVGVACPTMHASRGTLKQVYGFFHTNGTHPPA